MNDGGIIEETSQHSENHEYNWMTELRKAGRYKDSDEDWNAVARTRPVLLESEPIKKGLPIYYPGANDDLMRPLGLTDSHDMVFVDPVYSKPVVTEDILSQIQSLGPVVSDITEGEMGKGGKRVIIFDWHGKRTLTLYSEDATKFTPKESNNGWSLIYADAPTNSDRENIGNIYDPNNKAFLVHQLADGGHLLYKFSNHFLNALKPEDLGLEKLTTDSKSPKDFYRLVRQEPALVELLNVDDSLSRLYRHLTGGTKGGIIDNVSSQYFLLELRKLAPQIQSLNKENQQKVYQAIKEYLIPRQIPHETYEMVVANGSRYGINNQASFIEYYQKMYGYVYQVLPELNQIAE